MTVLCWLQLAEGQELLCENTEDIETIGQGLVSGTELVERIADQVKVRSKLPPLPVERISVRRCGASSQDSRRSDDCVGMRDAAPEARCQRRPEVAQVRRVSDDGRTSLGSPRPRWSLEPLQLEPWGRHGPRCLPIDSRTGQLVP
jgi:hypothetical protein